MGKVLLIARVSKTLIDRVSAREVLQISAETIDGKGGGREDFAQAGGSKIENLDLAFKQANRYFTQRLEEDV